MHIATPRFELAFHVADLLVNKTHTTIILSTRIKNISVKDK
jgi:hypothetical protein